MKSLARSNSWWPRVDHDIEEVMKSCKDCSIITIITNSSSTSPMELVQYTTGLHTLNFVGSPP